MSLNFFAKNTLSNNRRFWFAWLAMLVVVFIIHSLTLTIAPVATGDEISLIEIGRTTLNPQTNWSTNWSLVNDQPQFMPYYLGGALQELSLRASNFSMIGPRLFNLLGGIIAATMAVGWLISRKIPKEVSWLLGLVYLLDPLFVYIYRYDRVDAWTTALGLAACWILRSSANKIQQGQLNILAIAVAGSLTATAPFIQANALIVYPLVILELATLVWQGRSVYQDWKKVFTPLLAFTIGGIVATTLLVIPIWHHIDVVLTNFYWYSKYNATAGTSSLNSVIPNFLNLFRSFLISPILPLTALVGVGFGYRRNKLLLVSTLFAVTFVAVTRAYPPRAACLLPYCLVWTAAIFDFVPRSSSKAKASLRLIRSSVLILLLTWSIGISLILRPSLGLTQKSARDPNMLYEIARSEIGFNAKVFDDSYPFYFAGRSLNWQMFNIWLWDKRFENTWNEDTFEKFLSKVDYVILHEEPYITGGTGSIYMIGGESAGAGSINKAKVLEKAGFKYRKTLLANGSKTQRFFLDRAALGGGLPYGRYRLYSRENHQ